MEAAADGHQVFRTAERVGDNPVLALRPEVRIAEQERFEQRGTAELPRLQTDYATGRPPRAADAQCPESAVAPRSGGTERYGLLVTDGQPFEERLVEPAGLFVTRLLNRPFYHFQTDIR